MRRATRTAIHHLLALRFRALNSPKTRVGQTPTRFSAMSEPRISHTLWRPQAAKGYKLPDLM
jgi:hypothetical protein